MFDIQQIIDVIVAHVSIWGPAITAVAGILITVVKAIGAVRKQITEIKEDTDFKDVKREVATVISENKELLRCNKLLLDELTKIQGYADAKAKEEKK